MVERLSQAVIDAGMADTREQMRDTLDSARNQIAEHWVWYLVLGIALLLAGGAAAKIALGWIFMICGLMMIVHAFSAGRWPGFFRHDVHVYPLCYSGALAGIEIQRPYLGAPGYNPPIPARNMHSAAAPPEGLAGFQPILLQSRGGAHRENV